MNGKPYFAITSVIFALVALTHAARLFEGWVLQVGSVAIPMELSWAGLALPAVLSVWGFRLARGV